ncbi:MAG: prepilin peptidase [Deltaproteobacteria bacterium]|nr:prepilin peptidase [Deltaproteobacteria bacterium]
MWGGDRQVNGPLIRLCKNQRVVQKLVTLVPDLLIQIFVFAFGATIGSFLNVCIYRLPLKQSIVSPPSACPVCGRRLPFYDNMPILSYIILRGRCRGCGVSFSIRYLTVEVLTAIMAVAVYVAFGPTPESLVYFLFVSALIVITFIDLEYQIIPDVISLPGIGVGLLASLFLVLPGVMNSLIGIIVGGGLLYLVATSYYLLTGREGMGGGDIKLLAMIGAFLGWKGVIVTIFAGSLVGAILGSLLMAVKGRDSKYAIPFGPFLALGAVIYLFAGEDLIELYMAGLWHR